MKNKSIWKRISAFTLAILVTASTVLPAFGADGWSGAHGNVEQAYEDFTFSSAAESAMPSEYTATGLSIELTYTQKKGLYGYTSGFDKFWSMNKKASTKDVTLPSGDVLSIDFSKLATEYLPCIADHTGDGLGSKIVRWRSQLLVSSNEVYLPSDGQKANFPKHVKMAGYTGADAKFATLLQMNTLTMHKPSESEAKTNLSSMTDWMQDIVAAGDAKKANISTKNDNLTGYMDGQKTAVLTVTATDQELAVHKDTCNIIIKFKTVDTTPDVEGLTVNTENLTFNITRNLSGYRSGPSESYTISPSQKIRAWLSDDAPFTEDMTWSYEAGIIDSITKSVGGVKNSELTVGANFNPSNIAAAPSWIYNIIQNDNGAWNSNKSIQRTGSGTKTGKITAKTNDVTTVASGVPTTKDITVTINFRTNDSTYISTYTSSGGGGGSSSGGGGGSSSGGGGGGGSSSGSGPSSGSGATFSPNWFTDASGNWKIKNSKGQIVTNAWLCDDVIKTNGQNVWYLLKADGTMLAAGLVQDNTGNFYSLETSHNGYYGSLRYKNGTYDCNGKQVELKFNQEHKGAFGAIINKEGIEALKAIYGITKYEIGNESCVYTASF